MPKLVVCSSCGQKIRKLNPHRMDFQKVRVLEDIAKLNNSGHEWVQAKEGEILETEDGKRVRTAYRARAHASRLVWFGLLDYQGARTGAYRINARGLRFLSGLSSVPSIIYCKDGAVVERSDEKVRVMDVRKVILDKAYWDMYAQLQKYPKSEEIDA